MWYRNCKTPHPPDKMAKAQPTKTDTASLIISMNSLYTTWPASAKYEQLGFHPR